MKIWRIGITSKRRAHKRFFAVKGDNDMISEYIVKGFAFAIGLCLGAFAILCLVAIMSGLIC